jgi:hypothetical protein
MFDRIWSLNLRIIYTKEAKNIPVFMPREGYFGTNVCNCLYLLQLCDAKILYARRYMAFYEVNNANFGIEKPLTTPS